MVSPPRSLPPASRFADDDGACPPELARALGEADEGARLVAVVDALREARVLVPVVAHLDERHAAGTQRIGDGRATGGQGFGGDAAGEGKVAEEGRVAGAKVAGKKVASAALVTVAAPDGRAALPAFSSLASLALWDPTARPIPVEGVRAALAAVTESDSLLVLDPAGPVPVLIPRPAVWALGQGRTWAPSYADPEVAAGVAEALRTVPGLARVRCVPGERAELRVILDVPRGLGRAALDAVIGEVSGALAGSEVVAQRVDSLELRVVAAAPG